MRREIAILILLLLFLISGAVNYAYLMHVARDTDASFISDIGKEIVQGHQVLVGI
jgi:hypothetical protein